MEATVVGDRRLDVGRNCGLHGGESVVGATRAALRLLASAATN